MYRVHIDQKIADVGYTTWQELHQERSLYLSYHWLSSVEGMLSSTCFYISIWTDSGSRPLAAIPCYLITDQNTYLFFNVPRLLLDQGSVEQACLFLPGEQGERLVQVASSLQRYQNQLYPTLICVAPYGYISAVCYRLGLTAEENQAVIGQILTALDELAAYYSARCISFMYVPEQSDPYLPDMLIRSGYHPMLLDADCQLLVTWQSFEEYLATRTRGRRRTIRLDMRTFSESGLSIRLEDASALTERLASLQINLQHKYGHGSTLNRAMKGYERIKQYLGPWVRVFVAYKETEPLGFALAYEMNGVYYFKQAGFDYEKLGDSSCCYFNIVFYEPIRQAITKGIRHIQYGMGSYQAKLGRGCQLHNLWGYFLFPGEKPPLIDECIFLENQARRVRIEQLKQHYASRATVTDYRNLPVEEGN